MAVATASLLLVACSAMARGPFQGLEDRIVEVAEKVTPTVVHIKAIVKFNDRRNQVTGSGVIVTTDGTILTNEHVVDNAEKVEVSVPGHRKRYPALVIGTDRQTDVAVLKINVEEPLPAAELGQADDLQVGQWVLAIGNPYGLEGTVSFGIVSAKGRNLEIPHVLNDFIQTDAMIDHGSSGGPLVDLEGRVVGINSRGQGRGIGFTIPIETALQVKAQLEGGGIERGFLGITMQPMDRELADYFGTPDLTGVIVNSVVEDSPAARAGLQAGDIITHWAGTEIEAEQEEDLGTFQRMVASTVPGEEVSLRIRRAGARETLAIAIGSQPTVQPDEVESELGFHVQEITKYLARDHRLGGTDGAFVFFVARGSPAREAGIMVGDVIIEVEHEPVATLDDLENALVKVASLPRFLVKARRGEETRYLLVKPDDASDEAPVDAEADEVGLPR
jgi:S1-C subfamily serine protease